MNITNWQNTLIKNKNTLLLVSIMLLAVFLRLYKLGSIPVGPDWDEAAIGYNAYSLLSTGKDEFGKTLPFEFRSFNDYKPPLYIYLTMPTIALFGLNIWSVRLPSALMGILAVLGTYLLTKELINNLKRESLFDIWHLPRRQAGLSFGIPATASLLLAISPWHIQFSRVAFEANIGVTFNIWAAILFLKGLRNANNYYLSSLLFILGMYSYHTERIFVPLYMLLLSVLFLKQPLRHKKELLFSLGAAIILMLPMVGTFIGNTGFERLSSTSILTKQTEYLEKSVTKYNWDRERRSFLGQFLNDRRFEWVKVYASGYLAHFSPKWLFITGDYPRHHAPDSGLMYLWTIPFLGVGLLTLLKWSKTLATFLFGWLLLAPIASAFTFEVPHAVRTLVFLPSFQIITVVGIVVSIKYVHAYIHGAYDTYKKIIVIFLSICFIGFSLFEITRYLNLYFVHMNVEYSQYWQYGYEKAVKYAEENKFKYDRVVISTALEQPYIFFLFYSQYSPQKYLVQGGTEAKHFDVYYFRPIVWANEQTDGRTLFIDTDKNFPNPNKLQITSLNGEPVIAIGDGR